MKSLDLLSGVLQWLPMLSIGQIVVEGSTIKRSVQVSYQCLIDIVVLSLTDYPILQLEDPGSIVQVGFSAGALNKTAFHWARNLG